MIIYITPLSLSRNSALIIMKSGSLCGKERSNFIRQVARHDIFLAVKCLATALCREKALTSFLSKKALQAALRFDNYHDSAQGFLALMELKRWDLIMDVLRKLDKAYDTTQKTVVNIFRFLPRLFKTFSFEDILSFAADMSKLPLRYLDISKTAVPIIMMHPSSVLLVSEQKSVDLVSLRLFESKKYGLFLRLASKYASSMTTPENLKLAIQNIKLNKSQFKTVASVIKKYELFTTAGLETFVSKLEKQGKVKNTDFRRLLAAEFGISTLSHKKNRYIFFANGEKMVYMKKGDKVIGRVLKVDVDCVYLEIEGISSRVRCQLKVSVSQRFGFRKPTDKRPLRRINLDRYMTLGVQVTRIDQKKNKVIFVMDEESNHKYYVYQRRTTKTKHPFLRSRKYW